MDLIEIFLQVLMYGSVALLVVPACAVVVLLIAARGDIDPSKV